MTADPAGGTRTGGPERDLAHRFAAGDVEAVRDLYARYAAPVFTVAMSRLRDRGLAEEVVQEVFVKAWRAASTYDPDRALSPWLYQIARRTTADVARRERRRPVTTPLSEHVPGEATDSLDGAWERWEVRRALRDVPLADRELLYLTYHIGLTRTQVASRLGLPVNTVKIRIHRAQRALAGRLAHLRPGPGVGARVGGPADAGAVPGGERSGGEVAGRAGGCRAGG